MIDPHTNLTVLVLFLLLAKVIDLSKQSLALLLFFTFWLPHVVENAEWSKLLEELGPTLVHMGLVGFNAAVVPFF